MRFATLDFPVDAPIGDRPVGDEALRFADAASLDGLDGVLWDPNALAAGYADRLGADRVLTVAGSAAFLADLRRRRAELQALLDEGGALAIIAPGPGAVPIHTLEDIHDVPLATTLPVDGIATEARSAAALAFHGGAPFRQFWDATRDALAPAVRILDAPGEALLRDGDAVYGCYWARRRGRLLLLPPPRPAARRAFAEAVRTLLDALGGETGHRPPRWADRWVAADEAPLRDRLGALEAERARLDAAIAATRRALLPLEQRKQLVTGAGRALAEAVADAFWALGCHVIQGPVGDSDLVLEHAAGSALAWIAGGAGPLDPTALDRLDAAAASLARGEGTAPKGILIANPHRDRPPSERPAIDPALVARAAASRQLILTGLDLLGLTVAAGDRPAARDAAVAGLLTARGLWQPAPGTGLREIGGA